MAIQKAFHQYYSILYKGSDIVLDKIDAYLNKQNLLRSAEKQRDYEQTYNNKVNF